MNRKPRASRSCFSSTLRARIHLSASLRAQRSTSLNLLSKPRRRPLKGGAAGRAPRNRMMRSAPRARGARSARQGHVSEKGLSSYTTTSPQPGARAHTNTSRSARPHPPPHHTPRKAARNSEAPTTAPIYAPRSLRSARRSGGGTALALGLGSRRKHSPLALELPFAGSRALGRGFAPYQFSLLRDPPPLAPRSAPLARSRRRRCDQRRRRSSLHPAPTPHCHGLDKHNAPHHHRSPPATTTLTQPRSPVQRPPAKPNAHHKTTYTIAKRKKGPRARSRAAPARHLPQGRLRWSSSSFPPGPPAPSCTSGR